MTHAIDYGTGVVRLRIPRTCLGVPRWIRVAVIDVLTAGSQRYLDNPQNHAAFPSGLSPRLYRG